MKCNAWIVDHCCHCRLLPEMHFILLTHSFIHSSTLSIFNSFFYTKIAFKRSCEMTIDVCIFPYKHPQPDRFKVKTVENWMRKSSIFTCKNHIYMIRKIMVLNGKMNLIRLLWQSKLFKWITGRYQLKRGRKNAKQMQIWFPHLDFLNYQLPKMDTKFLADS